MELKLKVAEELGLIILYDLEEVRTHSLKKNGRMRVAET